MHPQTHTHSLYMYSQTNKDTQIRTYIIHAPTTQTHAVYMHPQTHIHILYMHPYTQTHTLYMYPQTHNIYHTCTHKHTNIHYRCTHKNTYIHYTLYMHPQKYICLVFTWSNTPLEICRRFPQLVFTLLTCVRPIKVGFLNRFCLWQIKDC